MQRPTLQTIVTITGIVVVGAIVLALGRGGEQLTLAAAAVAGVAAILQKEMQYGRLFELAFPLLIAAQIALAEPQGRLLVAGGVIAVVAMVVLIRRSDEMLPVVLAIIAIARFVPIGEVWLTRELVVFVSLLGFVLLLGWRRADVLAMAIVLALFVPADGVGAALLPLVLGVVILALRLGSPLLAGSGVLLALAGGSAMLPIAVVPALALMLTRRPARAGATGMAAIAPVSGFVEPLLRPLLFLPGAVMRLTSGSRAVQWSAVILLGVALFADRTFSAVLYSLSAVVLVWLAPRDVDAEPGPELPLVFAMLLLIGWSGVFAASFPLPAALGAVALIGILSAIQSAGRLPRLAAAAIAGAAVVTAAFVIPPMPDHRWHLHRTLGAGESTGLDLGGAYHSMTVTASVANLPLARGGERVGQIDYVTVDGRAWRRPIVIGQVADWGSFRPEILRITRNPIPRQPGGSIEGTGRGSYPGGSGTIELPAAVPIRAVRITASERLGAGQTLIVERIEARGRQ
jgi:hypothetical protein